MKIGNIDISALKIGSADVSAAYIGSTMVYSGGTQPQPSSDWVYYEDGDTIASTTNIYGLKGEAVAFANIFENGTWISATQSDDEVTITVVDSNNNTCYTSTFDAYDNVFLILSDIGCEDYINESATVIDCSIYILTTPMPSVPSTCSINFCGVGENDETGEATLSVDNGTSRLDNSDFSGLIYAGIIGAATDTIGEYCFDNSNGGPMTSLTISDSVTTIEHEAFNEVYGLTSLTIPDSVTSIGYWAFTRLTGLTSVTFEATTPPTFDAGDSVEEHASIFNEYCPPVIYVPANSLAAYRAIGQEDWTNDPDIIWDANTIIQPIS